MSRDKINGNLFQNVFGETEEKRKDPAKGLWTTIFPKGKKWVSWSGF